MSCESDRITNERVRGATEKRMRGRSDRNQKRVTSVRRRRKRDRKCDTYLDPLLIFLNNA
jgi:hypothetical protein